MSCALRGYVPEDFETLYAIDQACYPPGIAYTKRMLREFLRLPGVDCRVAEAAGQIVGFLLAERETARAHVITIDVLENHRRRGVGSELLRSVEQSLAACGVREVELETATDNHAAVAFWERHGYRRVGVLPRYYLGRHNAYFMRKRLVAKQS